MAYQNIYDLGDVDLFVEFGDSGALVPVAEASLAGGTIEEVDGVVQCRNLPSTIGGAAIRIVAVPRFDRSAPCAARVTASAPNIPKDDPFSDFQVDVGNNPTGGPTTDLEPVLVDDTCIGFGAEMPVQLSDLPADEGEGDDVAGLSFRFVEISA